MSEFPRLYVVPGKCGGRRGYVETVHGPKAQFLIWGYVETVHARWSRGLHSDLPGVCICDNVCRYRELARAVRGASEIEVVDWKMVRKVLPGHMCKGNDASEISAVVQLAKKRRCVSHQ